MSKSFEDELIGIRDCVELGMVLVLYAAQLLGHNGLTIREIKYVMNFPREQSTIQRLSQLEKRKLVERSGLKYRVSQNVENFMKKTSFKEAIEKYLEIS